MLVGYDMNYIRQHVRIDAWLDWIEWALQSKGKTETEIDQFLIEFQARWGRDTLKHIYIARGGAIS